MISKERERLYMALEVAADADSSELSAESLMERTFLNRPNS